jgi:hypothetical protein
MGNKQKYKPMGLADQFQLVEKITAQGKVKEPKYKTGDAIFFKDENSPTLIVFDNIYSEEGFYLVRVNWWNARDYRFEEEDFFEDMLVQKKPSAR